MKERLCSELNMLVQQSAHAQLEKLEQVQPGCTHVAADWLASTAIVALESRVGHQLVRCMSIHAICGHLLHAASHCRDARPLSTSSSHGGEIAPLQRMATAKALSTAWPGCRISKQSGQSKGAGQGQIMDGPVEGTSYCEGCRGSVLVSTSRVCCCS